MSHIKRIVVERPLLEVGCSLGEGPLYDASTSTLHFVDILKKNVLHLNLVDLEFSVETFDDAVTSLAFRANGRGLACTTSQGFALLEGNSTLKYISKPLPLEFLPHSRFNDGACDSKGRYFAGTLYSKEHNIPGQLWRYDPSDQTCVVVDEGPFTDSNGLGWSEDGKILYFTDSINNVIHAYDYDDGTLSKRRVFIDAMAQGLPERSYCDGMCIDSDGCVWSARWGSSQVIRFTKDGAIDVEIYFPTALNITACCFGGPNEDQLYVTTAHCSAMGGDASRQEKFPDSGHLFAVDLSGQYKGGKWRHDFAG